MIADAPEVFERLATDIPSDLHPHLLIVGSLAAGYHFREKLGRRAVQTKDADVIVQPAGAIHECERVAEQLLRCDWTPTEDCAPKDAPEPRDELRAVRLWPKGSNDYFVELLGLPESNQLDAKVWVPIQLPAGWYGVPCCRFMSLAAYKPCQSHNGLRYAHPAMMALANLLAHPRLDPALIRGTKIRRSAKDLGRVLGLAWLARGDIADWPTLWADGLKLCFPEQQAALALTVATGIHALVADLDALDEAVSSLKNGLLSGKGLGADALRATADRMEVDVVKPFAATLSQLGQDDI